MNEDERAENYTRKAVRVSGYALLSRAVDVPPNLLRAAWNGDAKLWEVWWILNFFIKLTQFIIAKIANLDRSALGYTAQNTFTLPDVIILGLQIALWRMIWICAPNVENPTMTTVARALVVLSSLGTLGQFVPNYVN